LSGLAAQRKNTSLIIGLVVTLVAMYTTDRPRFHCHRSHKARLHASDVSIECVLRHNPTPSQLYVTWYHHGGSRRVDDGDTGDDYRLLTSVGVRELKTKKIAIFD